MKNKFKEVFVELLQIRGISAYKFSADTGISQGSLSEWKNGIKTPSAESLITIADYFDVSVDYLLGRTDKIEWVKKHD